MTSDLRAIDESGGLRLWLPMLGVIAVVAAALAGVKHWREPILEAPVRGKPLPSIVATRLSDGAEVELATPSSRVALVNVWATWCAACQRELPYLKRLDSEYRTRGVTISAVSVDRPDAEKDITGMVAANKLPFGIFRDYTGSLYQRLGLPGIPATFVVDSHGLVTYVQLGELTEAEPRLRHVLDSLTAMPASADTAQTALISLARPLAGEGERIP